MNHVPVLTKPHPSRFAQFLKISAPAFPGCLLAIIAILAASPAFAVPYATSLTNNSGTISFRLNESADVVKVISNGGATVNDLGALPAGLHTVALGISGSFNVSVFKASAIGFTAPVAPNRAAILQISPNTNITRFNSPRGLAVNTDPASPYFGRVYVANGSAGTTTSNVFGPSRSVSDGIYVLNPDYTDALGQGDSALNGGLNFTIGLDVSPYRLSIGQDNNLYVAEWGDTNGSLYVVDPNVSAGSGANVLGGPTGSPFPVHPTGFTGTRFHGSIAAAVVEGSLAQGNLVAYVIDEDLQTDRASATQNMRNSLWRHDIGGALPGPEVLPTRIGNATPWINFASQTMDVSRSTNGNFYVNDYRSTGTDRGGVYVLDPTGAELWNSLAASRTLLGDAAAPDFLRATGGGAVSPLGDYIAVINLESNGITVVPLIGGIPDIANRLVFHGFGVSAVQGRDVAFDLAGNLYAVSSGAQALRVFSPGGTTTAITGSEGTFELIRPAGVSVTVVDSLASESAPDTARFTLTRSGDTSTDLTVSYTLTGSATNGTDFETNALSAVIPAGSSSVDVVITPIDDSATEVTESVTLTLVGTAQYDVKAPVVAVAYITDNESAVINVSATDATAYERFPADRLVFQIERIGQTNSELFVVLGYAGSAIGEIDFRGLNGDFLPLDIYLAPGQVSQTVSVEPLDDLELEGDETVGLVIQPGFDYSPGTPDTAFAVIKDNELPAERVLFADDMDNTAPGNWTVRFGANNGIYDADVRWGLDYTTLIPAIPASPHSSPGSTRGLYLQVNRTNSAANGTAGINVYPGRNFSGNFALRADMYLSYELAPAGSTEHALIGLNHSGLLTNRATITTADASGNAVGGDGVWNAIGTDASNSRDWSAYFSTNATTVPGLYTNRSAASVATLLSAPPYALAGSPGNRAASTTKTWAEVELGQIDNVITLKVNNSVVYSFLNPSGFTSGDIMIGHNDQADSIGSRTNFVIFDNVRVISLDFTITSISFVGNTVQIDFDSPLGGQAADFHLQSTGSLLDPIAWDDENSATITALAQGFRFALPREGDTRFYRIRR
jgi:hypothetical protein